MSKVLVFRTQGVGEDAGVVAHDHVLRVQGLEVGCGGLELRFILCSCLR